MKCLLLFATFVAVALCDPLCPAGYSNYNNQRCYKVYTSSKLSSPAVQCSADGGSLASISNSFENSYAISLGLNASVAAMWIGVSCTDVNKNSCVNDDGSDFGPYDNFYSNNPSVLGPCVYMSLKAPTTGYWMSYGCYNTLPFLCEVEYNKKQCQAGYTYSLGSCYRINSGASENAAEQACMADCGHLVSIHSAEENSLVTNLALKSVVNYDFVRIGLKADVNSNNNYWSDNSPFNYSNIGYRNPNAGQCFGLSLVDRIVLKGQWSSANCDSQFPYICKTAPGSCNPVVATYAPPTCSGPQSFEGTGTIYSPGYPSSFGYNPNCVYFITTTPGSVVEIDFVQDQLVPFSSISLYNDWGDAQPFASINYANSSHVTSYQSSDNQMVIIFSYTSQSTGGLWKINYKPAVATPKEPCPSDYTLFDGVCYQYVTKKLDRINATANCRRYAGGNLATVANGRVNGFLIQLVNQQSTRVYIGLYCPNIKKSGDTSTCYWDDGTPFDYKSFLLGNPYTGFGMACIDFDIGVWVNDSCGKWYSVCQAPAYV